MDRLEPTVQLLFVRDSKIIILLSFLLFALPSLGQEDIRLLPDWKIKSMAKTAQLDEEWYLAIEYYEELISRTGETKENMSALGQMYWNAKDYLNANGIYETLVIEYPEDGEYLLRFAKLEKNLGKHESAMAYFERYQRQFLNNKPDEEKLRDIQLEIEGCELALKKGNNPRLEIFRLPNNINYPHIETNPVPLGDSLFFSSIRTDKIEHLEGEAPKSQIYLAVERDSTWYLYDHMLNLDNQDDFNISNLAFNHNKTLLAFTKCERKNPSYYRCDIYLAEKVNGNWKEPKELKALNTKNYTQTQPCFAIGPDGSEMIYFVSDQPGGVGGKDLWYTLRDKSGNFKSIKNCGAKVNSPRDEITPWYDNESKTLYFSSNGIPGYGNMDVFSVNGYASKWASTKNLGAPINTGADDLYYIAKDSVSGFFTSNRQGVNSLQGATCCDDIFRYQLKKIVKIEVEGNVSFIVPGDKDKESVTVGLYKDLGNKSVLLKETKPDKDGNYSFSVDPDEDYKIVAEKDGYLKGMTDFNTQGVRESKKEQLDPIKLLVNTKEPIVVRNIYYPFDKAYLTEDSKTNIDTTIFEILKANPTIKVEISSHTDWFGSDKYNETLSQGRAESVVNYLIEKGIPADRLVAKGYGEKKPLVPNQNPDGSDNPENRARNRRTEFKIVGYLPQYEEVIYEE